MNRAARRRIGRLQDRAPKSPLHFDQFLEEANRQSDPTKPLTYTGGYVHTGCGGKAERPSNYGAGAYCQKCGHTIPVEEIERE